MYMCTQTWSPYMYQQTCLFLVVLQTFLPKNINLWFRIIILRIILWYTFHTLPVWHLSPSAPWPGGAVFHVSLTRVPADHRSLTRRYKARHPMSKQLYGLLHMLYTWPSDYGVFYTTLGAGALKK